jgi:allantoate deiminase
MRECMSTIKLWMEAAGLSISVDAVGNLRGLYPGAKNDAPRLIIGSHLDTVPNAGAFDGILGVMLGLALVESLAGRRLSFAVELIGFSEEEGVRFRTPFIGSRALVGRIDESFLSQADEKGTSIRQAIMAFGLDPNGIDAAVAATSAVAYLEFHIEQGPVLESMGRSLAVVNAVAGQTRGEMIFTGSANHAGTTPMHLRRDALAAASHWISQVEELGRATNDLVATVGRMEVLPGVGNVIAGEVRASLDVRHQRDNVRVSAVETLVQMAQSIAQERRLQCKWSTQLDHAAVPMNEWLSRIAYDAIRSTGTEPLRMMSGAGHDAMLMAERLPSAMIFVRSPGGISHHPDETVRLEDVGRAVVAGINFLQRFDEAVRERHA